jgi:hypothetical protein
LADSRTAVCTLRDYWLALHVEECSILQDAATRQKLSVGTNSGRGFSGKIALSHNQLHLSVEYFVFLFETLIKLCD